MMATKVNKQIEVLKNTLTKKLAQNKLFFSVPMLMGSQINESDRPKKVKQQPEMIKPLPILCLCFLLTLMACASQNTIFVPFDKMDVSFQKLERQENGEWFITGRVTDRQSGNAIPGVNVLVAESRDVNLSKSPKANPALRAGAATDREGYFEIRSANIKAEDVIIIKFRRF